MLRLATTLRPRVLGIKVSVNYRLLSSVDYSRESVIENIKETGYKLNSINSEYKFGKYITTRYLTGKSFDAVELIKKIRTKLKGDHSETDPEVNAKMADLLLNSLLMEPEAVKKADMLHLANLLASSRTDVRTFINYELLMYEISKRGFFNKGSGEEDLTPVEYFLLEYRPYLSIPKLEYYNRKLTKFQDAVAYVKSIYEEASINEIDIKPTILSIQKVAYSPLVDLIRDSMLLGDPESTVELIEIYKEWYLAPVFSQEESYLETVPPEDFHTFISSFIQNPDANVAKLLLDENFMSNNNISITDKDQILVTLARFGLDKEFFQLSDMSSIEMTEKNLSLVSELYFEDLGVPDTLNLVNNITKSGALDPPNYQDYKFLTDYLKNEIIDLSINRKDFDERDPNSTQKSKRLFIQRIDINNQIDSYYDIFQNRTISQQTKALLADCLTSAVSSVTNATGLIHLYLRLPPYVVNKNTMNIILHNFSRGEIKTHTLRIIELWNFAKDEDLLDFKTMAFVLEFCLRESPSEEFRNIINELINDVLRIVILDLDNGVKSTEKKKLRLKSLNLTEVMNLLLSANSNENKKELRNTLAGLEIPEPSIELHKLKAGSLFDIYDVKETNLLQRRHSKFGSSEFN